jgi:hypothetical protein
MCHHNSNILNYLQSYKIEFLSHVITYILHMTYAQNSIKVRKFSNMFLNVN